MSYVALYRKFRPNTFDEIKGQDFIVTTLKNQVKYNRIGHAYLFCGTRGTGKTTAAKILAKVANCENPIDGNPCNKCASCRSISEGSAMNVIEMDAASNNGVDNIRQINEAVRYSPTQGKYLVYIIDEVHMLSSGAYNALLKTLEEPPEYVIFILATTEAHAIPVTILSRCQRYDFRRISVETISDRMEELLARENEEAERTALDYIARTADGSMRDALSILDRCISFNMGEKLTYEKVIDTIGAVDIDVFVGIMQAMAAGNVEAVMDYVDDMVWQGREIGQFVNDFSAFIRNVLFAKISSELAAKLDMSKDNLDRVLSLKDSFSEETLTRYINVLQELSQDIKYTAKKRIPLELALIKMCRPVTETDYTGVIGRLELLEKQAEKLEELQRDIAENKYIPAAQAMAVAGKGSVGTEYPVQEKRTLTPEEQSDIIRETLRKEYTPADSEELERISRAVKGKKVPNISKPAYAFLLENSQLIPGENAGILLLKVANIPDNQVAILYFANEKNLQALEEAITEFAQRSVRILFQKITAQESESEYNQSRNILKINFKVEIED